MKLIFHVPMWVLLLMFSFTASDSNFTSETYTLITATNIAKPGCESRCGDLIVPYPFGIDTNSTCSIAHEFEIYCNTSIHPPVALIKNANTGYTPIKNISDSTLRVSSMVATRCYSPNGTATNSFGISPDLTNSPYTFSRVNKFIALGCNDYAWMTSESMPSNVSTGCVVFCTNLGRIHGDECSGNGCCQSSIDQDITYYQTQLSTLLDADDVGYTKPLNRCTYAFLAEKNVRMLNGVTDLYDTSFRERIEANVSVVLEWAISNLSCEAAEAADGFACQSNSKCVNSPRVTGGYRCMCNDGYEGNPYLSHGCQGSCSTLYILLRVYNGELDM
ncbi:wall-associated receptor kinase 2-like [Bidens hawaiensis]|uniref:wall-associated receptor kinase 2-like n=1 Tax=Bidens hawaiensis TaxID=980011 RepID=UPI0040491D5B